jgi:hypothetical protein
MRKALLTAFVIAGSFVGCTGAPPAAPPAVHGTHTVVGEASVNGIDYGPIPLPVGDGPDNPGGCPRSDPACHEKPQYP